MALQRPLRARRVLALGAVVLLVHLLDVILEMLALPCGVGTLLTTALEPRVRVSSIENVVIKYRVINLL